MRIIYKYLNRQYVHILFGCCNRTPIEHDPDRLDRSLVPRMLSEFDLTKKVSTHLKKKGSFKKSQMEKNNTSTDDSFIDFDDFGVDYRFFNEFRKIPNVVKSMVYRILEVDYDRNLLFETSIIIVGYVISRIGNVAH